MKKYLCYFFIPLLTIFFNGCTNSTSPNYASPKEPWPESFGNHRAVLKVAEPAEVVKVKVVWRRNDRNPEARRFLIVEAATGDTVQNILRYQVSNEYAELAFGPVKNSGIYHFYYLPYTVQEGWGFYGGDYLKPEPEPERAWIAENNLSGNYNTDSCPVAKVDEIQSRTAFDSFYPMQVIPLASEKEAFLTEKNQDYFVFPEDRTYPIRMLNEIPLRWIRKGFSAQFKGEAFRNEYYAFQIGVYAAKTSLSDIRVEFTPLTNGRNEIPATSITCFNTGGIDPYGKPFIKRVDVPAGAVQPLWIGVDIAENTRPGNYRGKVTVTPGNAAAQTIEIRIKVENKVLADRGDSELWRHSRLRWLNSTLGIDDEPTLPYKGIEPSGENSYTLTDKEFFLHESGMPQRISVGETEILFAPLSFVVETNAGYEQFTMPTDVVMLKDKPGIKSASWKSQSENFTLSGKGTIESDGYINYKITLKASEDLQVNDIRLEIPFRREVASFMKGMGLPGTKVPRKHSAPWSGPHDSFWIGNTQAGLWCELRGGEYHGPLLNLYKPAHPKSWYNSNKGGFRIEEGVNTVKAVAFSGQRTLQSNEEIAFEWSMLITPVKPLNYSSQFTDRYYHDGMSPMPSEEELKSGIKIVNLHHANNYNPYINYPFIEVDSMKWFVDQLHKKGQKVKIDRKSTRLNSSH